MKKIIGIIGVFAIAIAMVFNVNSMNNTSENLDLSSLLTMSVANAETVPACATSGGYYQGAYLLTPGPLCRDESGNPCGIPYSCPTDPNNSYRPCQAIYCL